jgi:putative chitinase
MKVTGSQLKQIVGGKAPLAVEAALSFTEWSDVFEINTPLRAAHFWSQVGHESKLVWTTEIWQPTAAQTGYEGRKDLGNTHPGDGKLFMGHSLIQVTGRANHVACRDWIRARGIDCPDFEQTPEKLAEFPWAMMGAFWYWDTRKINALADKDDVLAVSIKINGRNKKTKLPNGYEDRKALLAKAKIVFGVTPSMTQAVPVTETKPTKIKKARVWAESLLSVDEIKYVQQRLLDLGYHEVGLVDGIWATDGKVTAAVTLLQSRAVELGEKVIVDGHYGPQTKDLIDPIYKDKYRRVVTAQRANATSKDLAAIGNPGVTKGNKIKWASAFGVLSSVVAAAVAAYQAPTELPMGSSIFLAFLPGPAAAIVSSVAPYALTFCVSLYTTYKGQDVVDTSVERFREGIDNSGLPPQLDHNLGGFLSNIFKK